METKHYTVVLEPEDEGGYHAFCPALKGCHTQGESIEETLINIREAIEVYLESLKAQGEEIPNENIFIKPIEITI